MCSQSLLRLPRLGPTSQQRSVRSQNAINRSVTKLISELFVCPENAKNSSVMKSDASDRHKLAIAGYWARSGDFPTESEVPTRVRSEAQCASTQNLLWQKSLALLFPLWATNESFKFFLAFLLRSLFLAFLLRSLFDFDLNLALIDWLWGLSSRARGNARLQLLPDR